MLTKRGEDNSTCWVVKPKTTAWKGTLLWWWWWWMITVVDGQRPKLIITTYKSWWNYLLFGSPKLNSFPLWTWQFDRIEEKFLKRGEKKGEMESALDDHWVGWEYSTVQDAPLFWERPQFHPLFWRKHQEHVILFIDFFKAVTRLNQRHLLVETKLLISEQSETSSRLSVNQEPQCEPKLILNGQVYSSGRALLSLHTEPLKS